MKKLMFVAAVAAAMTGVCEVSSQNVVGYANDGLTSGQWKPVCSQFLKIGTDGSTMTLADLKPNYTGDTTKNWQAGDMIRVYNTSGGVNYQAKYRPSWAQLTDKEKETFGNDETTFTPGWYKCDKAIVPNITTECVNSLSLPFGSSVMARTTKSQASFLSSGEVYESEDGFVEIGFTAGQWRFVGNCTPVDRKLVNFTPNYDGTTSGWQAGDIIRIYNTSGGVNYQAKYRPSWAQLTDKEKATFGNDETTFTPGWYKCDKAIVPNITTECVNDLDIKAGAGFMAKSTKSTATIKLPSAL